MCFVCALPYKMYLLRGVAVESILVSTTLNKYLHITKGGTFNTFKNVHRNIAYNHKTTGNGINIQQVNRRIK